MFTHALAWSILQVTVNKRQTKAIIVLFLIILVVIWALKLRAEQNVQSRSNALSVPMGSSTISFDLSVSDGTITFAYPSSDFALATDPMQMTVRSYILPCDQDLSNCLYYVGTKYKGTNFETAGLRIEKRVDYTNAVACMNTAPINFAPGTKPDSIASDNGYFSAVYSNIGYAGAGHTASGSLYRLYIERNSSCYEFETRIGQSQFSNYPAGSIRKFSASDAEAVKNELKLMLEHVSLNSGQDNLFQ